MSKKTMTIVGLQAENVKRLRAVSIKPSGAVVKVKGRNGQGKTSLLDSIQLALGGKGIAPPEVIRRGEESAQVVVDLGDLVVTRRWTSNERSYLEVRSKDGARYPSPQGLLDKLTSSLAFDPLAFMRQKPAEQLAVVRELVGVDTAKLDQERKALFDRRTAVNREAAAAKARLDAIPAVEAPDEEVSIQELLQERQLMQDLKAENERCRRLVGDRKREVDSAEREVQRIEAEVAELERRLQVAREALAGVKMLVEENRAKHAIAVAAAAKLVDPDFDQVDEELRTVEATNKAVRQKKERAQHLLAHQNLLKRADELTEAIAGVDGERQALVATAKFPVPGMGFSDDGITLNGLPLEQASSAERLKLSFAMAIARNPELKIVLIRDGSLLDEDSLALIEQMATDAGAQVWCEMVGKGGDVSVLIEDGEASGPDAQPVEASA